MQAFFPGAVPWSEEFFLTLGVEGVELPEGNRGINCDWGGITANVELPAEALQFQRVVMPLLYESKNMQSAVAEIIARERHLRLVAAGKLCSKSELKAQITHD
jgi:hypothetical protein